MGRKGAFVVQGKEEEGERNRGKYEMLHQHRTSRKRDKFDQVGDEWKCDNSRDQGCMRIRDVLNHAQRVVVREGCGSFRGRGLSESSCAGCDADPGVLQLQGQSWGREVPKFQSSVMRERFRHAVKDVHVETDADPIES
eukprot:760709-Hanusia_phi.AAC.6